MTGRDGGGCECGNERSGFLTSRVTARRPWSEHVRRAFGKQGAGARTSQNRRDFEAVYVSYIYIYIYIYIYLHS